MIGPTPPPHHGPAVWTRMVLDAPALRDRFELLHLDTSDRRDLGNIGRLDLRNVQLAVLHLARALRICLTTRPALVHVQPSQNALAFLRDAGFVAVARIAGARVVLHLHGEAFGEFHRTSGAPVRLLIEGACRLSHRVWVLGDDLARVFNGLVPASRIRSVPNGLPDAGRAGLEPENPPRGDAAEGGRRHGAADRPIRLLHLGQVALSKGVDRAIRATADAIRNGADVELVIAGGWGSAEDERVLGQQLSDARADARVGNRIRTVGVVLGREKVELLRSADAFLLLSRFPPGEGQPLAILEAMCAGVPVIASDRGAIPETLGRGDCGVLVASDADVDRALATLVDDPDAFRSRAIAARERFRCEYTEEAFLHRFEEALAEALDPAATDAAS